MNSRKIILLILIILSTSFGTFVLIVGFSEKFLRVEEGIKIESKKEEIFGMKLISPAFEENNTIPKRYTCDGENVSPPLEIINIPKETKSLALIVYDPDAPGGDWTHWLIWNLSPGLDKLNEDQVPIRAVQGTNDFGEQNYKGPCPPSGTHRYFFKIYALDINLNLPVGVKRKDLESGIQGHILDQATLVGLYKRM